MDITESALLRAIIDELESDTPRLTYADWCDDHGQPERAEFIRVQCELARLPRGPFPTCHEFAVNMRPGECCDRCETCKTRFALRRRERDMWNFGMPGTWVDGIKPPFDCYQCIDTETISRDRARDPILVYRRGFVDEIRVPTIAAWLGGECAGCLGCTDCDNTGRTPGIGPAVVAAHPARRVVVADREPQHYVRPSIDVWGWRATPDGRPFDVSKLVWDKIAELHPEAERGSWVDFDSRDLALAALSDAMIRLAAKCPACKGAGKVRWYDPVQIEAVDDCTACAGTGDIRKAQFSHTS